jgi:hypothetical protein
MHPQKHAMYVLLLYGSTAKLNCCAAAAVRRATEAVF